MALNKEAQKKLLKALKVPDEKITELVDAEGEVDMDVPALTVLDETGLNRIKNSEYGRGKDVAIEQAVKEAKEKLGLEFQGKSIDGLIEAAQKKTLADAKIAPDKKVEELSKDLETLKATNKTLSDQIAEKDKAVSSSQTERELFKAVPTLGENAPDVDTVVTLMKAKGYEMTMHENKLAWSKDGQILKDNTANVLPVKDVVMNFAKENRLITEAAPPPAGRGAGDGEQKPFYSKLSEVKREFTEAGKSLNGLEFSDKVAELVKANPEFSLTD